MEHRLCYQRGGPSLNNVPNVDPSAAPLPREEAEALLQQERQRLNTLQNQIGVQKLDAGLRALQDDPAQMEEIINIRKTTLKDRSKALSDMLAVELEGAKKGIADSLAGKERTDILNIIASLQKPLPPKNGAPHRYGNTEAGVDITRIENDQRYIRSLIPAFPAAAESMKRVDTALTQLCQQDFRYEVRQIELMNSNHKADAVIGKMFQMTGVLVMVAGALVTGIPAIVHAWKNKKLDIRQFTPALLYAAVATIIANPHIRRQLFSSAEQNTLTDIDTTLNNPKFREICENYHLQGPASANMIRKMMESPAETKKITAKLRSKGQSTAGLEKDIEAYVNSMTTDVEMRGQLLRMFNDHRFSDLAHMLSFTVTPEAKEVCLDYIRIGARPYNAQAQQIRNTMNTPGTL